MKRKSICAVVLICIVFAGGLYCFITGSIENQKKIEIKQLEESKSSIQYNIDSNYIYRLYGDMSDIEFDSEDGRYISLKDFNGKNIIFTYWDSEFEDSKAQVSHAEHLVKEALNYDDTRYILIHRSDDNNPQIKEKAIKYLKENNINVEILFDKNMSMHYKLGLKSVPATLSVDKNGCLIYLKEGMMTDDNLFRGVIDKTRNSASLITEKFVYNNMTNLEGGVNITLNNNLDDSDIVLSESQGIMIEYADIKGDEELFNTTLSYINKYMKNDRLISWKVEDGKASRVNAAIDDLRVYDALYDGMEKFGVKEKELKSYSRSIYKYNVDNNNLVDCYDFENNSKSHRLTLCYGDFKALGKLWAENWRFKNVYYNTLEIVKNGYINDEFPLYYSWYNYESSRYEKDDLNTSEALVTILHLSEVGEVKSETINWLKEQVNKGTLYGRYSIDGKVSEGYEYESTAAYALAALIGKETGDDELIHNAVLKMEKMRIDDAGSQYYGAFGNPDGSGIYSFDQCMALLSYAELER